MPPCPDWNRVWEAPRAVGMPRSDLDFPGGILVGTQKISGLGSVTARVGVAPLPTVLLYVKGGAVWISESYDLALTPTGAALFLGDPTQAGPVGNVSFSKSGWTAGGGVERAFLNNASVFAAYEQLGAS
jgi:opacity protein-like surface antigen